ncbi:MAG: site-2 protease family protein [Myxococcota bacterium]
MRILFSIVLGVLLGFGAFQSGLVAAFVESKRPVALLNLVALPFLNYLSILAHEIGHQSTARLLGFDVPRVMIGAGRRLTSIEIRGTHFVLNLLPSFGLTYVGGLTDRPRRDSWLTVAAGPIATLLLIGVASLFASALYPSQAVFDMTLLATECTSSGYPV